MPEGPKHHYIPVFYQRAWCGGTDRRLCEYSRPYKTVIARRRYPTETGFERGLYTLNAHSPAVAEIVENRLMRQTDQYAALALQHLLRNDISGLDDTTRSGWARFILSLMRRTPEALKALGERITIALMQEFPQLALPGDPAADDQVLARQGLIERQRAMVLQSTITSEWVGTHLINMRWSVVTFSGAKHLILTSDRPFVMTNGIGKPDSHIVMPISPTQCFLAANTLDIEGQIHRIPAKEFMHKMNDKMACQARKYVYGVDDSQLRFVSNRFGRKDIAGPGDA
jgi:Protein of unknown function (DUF4238)